MKQVLLLLLSITASNTRSAFALRCRSGFGHQAHDLVEITQDQINDGYCDCPLDGGIDEPHTDACSGSINWAGIRIGVNNNDSDNTNTDNDDDDNDGSIMVMYTCPQQPHLQIPLSRLNDGICDCCDGSDEEDNHNTCKDICDDVLAQERKDKQELYDKYHTGAVKRQEALDEYQAFVQESLQEYESIQDVQIPKTLNAKRDLERNVHAIKDDLLLKHLRATGDLLDMVQASHVSIPGNVNQLMDIIAAICQVYGEVTVANKETDDVCVPLIEAGIDVGILWNTAEGSDSVEKIKVRSGAREDKQVRRLIAGVLMARVEMEQENEKFKDLNVEDPEDEFHTDDYYYNHDNENDYGDDDFEDFDMDDDDHDHDEEDDPDYTPPTKSHRRGRGAKNKQQTMTLDDRNSLEFTTRFGKIMRQPFHEQARKVMTKMNDILMQFNEGSDTDDDFDDIDKDDEVEEEEEEEEVEEEEEEVDDIIPMPSMDPMALQMNLNNLSRRIKQVGHGHTLGHSASMMLQALEQNSKDDTSLTQDLKRLVLATAYHTKIGAADLAEIVTVIHADVDVDVDANGDNGTCYSPYMTLCGNSQVKYSSEDGSVILFPPRGFQQNVEERCSVRKMDNEACIPSDDDDDSDIPTTIPNGYFNYYESKPRGENTDFLSRAFETYNDNIFDNPTLIEMNNEVSDHTQELEKLKARKTEIMENFGRGDFDSESHENKKDKKKKKDEIKNYGPKGELYNLRDDCFDITSNQYTYEVCMFGSASQRDAGSDSKRGRGTDLGKWDKMTIDKTTGVRVMKWKGGMKCWNGPKRSATVHVTCGTEKAKLISADEPNICEYAFHMESYIGCDESFRRRHNL